MMKSGLVLVVIVIVLVAARTEAKASSEFTCSSDCKHHKNCSPANATAGFAVLAIENVAVYCKKKDCTHKSSLVDWSLHGLWPSKKADDSESTYRGYTHHHKYAPVYCNLSSSFDKDSVEDLHPSMKKYWSSLKDKDDSKFWTHEWCKHGTCAVASQKFPSITDQHSYFQKALELYQQVNVGESLRGISTKTTAEEIVKAFKNKPKLNCKHLHHDKQVLETMEFCFTTIDFKPVPCQLEWFEDTTDVCKDGTVQLKY